MDSRIIRLMEQSEFTAASNLCDSLISAGVEDSRVLAQKAEILSAMGEKKESVPFYEKALKLDYKNSDIHMDFATTLMEMERIGRAITEFRVALRFAGEKRRPLIYRNLGVAYIKMNQRDRALKNVLDGLDISGKDPYLKGLKAMLIIESRPVEAESLFVDLRKSGKAGPTFLYHFGILLMERERWKEAAEVLEDALASRPSDREIMLNLAESWIMAGQPQKALNLMRGDKEWKEEGLYKIGRSLEKMQRYREALEIYRSLESSAKVMDRMGRCYFLLGNDELALKWARKAAEARPGWPVAMINLAVVLADTGRLDEAAGLLERVLEIDPDNSTAKFNLERLRKAQR